MELPYTVCFPFPYAIGGIPLCCTIIAVHAHQTIAMKAVYRTMSTVYRYLVVVHSQAITLSITVREKTPLQ